MKATSPFALIPVCVRAAPRQFGSPFIPSITSFGRLLYSSASVNTFASSSNTMSTRTQIPLGLHQMQDDESSTFTYLIWDPESKDAILVDPVDIQIDRDMHKVEELGLNLIFGDHITGTGLLKERLPNLKSVISRASAAQADVKLDPGDRIEFGNRHLLTRATPGHTAGCMSYVADDESFVLTGDTLLIQGCGRTDFQGGSATTLYESVHEQLFTLPDETTVYPAHDYKGNVSSTIANEKKSNPRLKTENTVDDFVEIMKNLNLSYPKKIDVAVPANLRCGVHEVGGTE